ncbi:2-iminobutanoate/2-iminopropanoate deaminase [Arthrobacter sp. V4I6]|uniref:RidA family protein n=1 Tax=unclassified Arthrobacter TaxID=235627 RepID=UPI002787133C|nr:MULTISPECIES: RidA family protein [unclassified Arthrobacter]MDQ0822846.1 2-iminobutanoate/2-iminopropanoate deaminase [Arthrobacter sp. V1I7]MDQ0852475.1 2-iminobutanoate/2-iminopropanoate deaminase [Arthrobacter sp. V4I6]
MTVLPTDRPTVLPVGGGIRRIAEIPGGAAAVGPFSQAVVANGFVFTAGQIPAISGLDDQPDTFEDQVRQTLRNLQSVLEAAGSGLEHVVKVNAYLTDPGRLEDYNRVYTEFFATARPARTTVCVSLWGVSLEIECVAVLAGEAVQGTDPGAVAPGAP